MDKQVNKSHYNFGKYCFYERWASYWYQLGEIFKLQPQSILEVGVGDKVIKNYLQTNTNISYQSVDIAEDLQPDIISNVNDLKISDNSFDVVCAFEVLEHLPFEQFARSLKEMRRVAKKNILISLPHWGRHFSLTMWLPGLKKITWQKKLSLLPVEHKFNGQHYWEIGKQGYELKKIRQIIKDCNLKIVRDYIAHESPYHHFFVLEK